LASLLGIAANPRGNSELTLNGTKVTIEYGRPALHGRNVNDMLGRLQVGGFWRLGADQSTTFTTTGDLDFDGTKVPQGAYSLWAQKVSDNSWKLVFNSQHGIFGTEHDPSKDVYSVPLKMETEQKSAEQVTIKLEKEHGGGEIAIEWGTMELTADFKPSM
jgi:hypothetical protein